jgi:hypothetical protein
MAYGHNGCAAMSFRRNTFGGNVKMDAIVFGPKSFNDNQRFNNIYNNKQPKQF